VVFEANYDEIELQNIVMTIVVFEANYDEIELQNIVMTSSPLRYRETSPK